MSINGVLLFNKPLHVSSNQALQKIKRLFGVKKAGHTGSLDPLATGMLPLCFGEATKYSQYLLSANKSYQATGILGIKTSTSDSEGEVIQTLDPTAVTEAQLLETLNSFVGEQLQTPSMYSALKHQGVPLYKLARQGIELERKPRSITVFSLNLVNFTPPHFSVEVVCSKGTYIRNLVEDIGDALSVGAHVCRLHRTFSMPYEQQAMYTLEELEQRSQEQRQDLLLSMDSMVSHLHKINLEPSELDALYFGQQVARSFNLSPQLVRVYDGREQFMGIGELIDSSHLKAKRLLKQ